MNYGNKAWPLAFAVACIWTGCRSNANTETYRLSDGPGKPSPKAPFQFKETTKPQHATFYTELRYGDFGCPVLKPNSRRPVQVGGTPVYLSYDAEKKIGSLLTMPLVEARVHLESSNRTASTIPQQRNTFTH